MRNLVPVSKGAGQEAHTNQQRRQRRSAPQMTDPRKEVHTQP